MRKVAFRTLAALIFVLVPIRARAQSFSQGFETDTSGWYDFGNGSIARQPSGFSTNGGYADAIPSASGSYHARLHVDSAANFDSAGNPQCNPGSTDCAGPSTDWGLNFASSSFPAGGVATQADIYLDTSFAATHTDYRFDWDSALNDSTGQLLQDFAFNVGTGNGQPSDPCVATGDTHDTAHFVIGASTNTAREGTYPEDPKHNPQCISTSGWYTFRHVFKPDANGNLEVDMSIISQPAGNTVASWTLHPTCMVPQSLGLCTEGQALPISAVGGNAYGWFPNQEIDQLAIDNTTLETLKR